MNFRLKSVRGLLGVLVGIAAIHGLGCGNKKNLRNLQGAGNAEALQSRFLVDGTVRDGGQTNLRVQKFQSRYFLPEGLGDYKKIKVHVVVKDPAGQTIFDNTGEGLDIEWTVEAKGPEGEYTLVATPSDHGIVDVEVPPPVTIKFGVDQTPPRIAVSASLGLAAEDGTRPVIASVVIDGDSGVACNQARLNLPEPNQPIALKMVEDQTAGGARTLRSEAVAVPSQILTGASVAVRCVDQAGNASEVVEPTSVLQRRYGLTAHFSAEPMVPDNIPELTAVKLYFLPQDTAEVKLGLVDMGSAKELGDTAIEAEKPLLRIFVTTTQPKVMADLDGAGKLLSQPFERTVKINFPANIKGQSKVHFTLVRRNTATGQEEIMSTVSHDVFVDSEGPTVSLLNQKTVISAARDEKLHFEVKIVNSGAPIVASLVEFTTDGETFEAPIVLVKEPSDGANHKFSTHYGHTAERAMRARIKVKDASGRFAVSGLSSLLVQRGPSAYTIPEAEKQACRVANAPASKLTLYAMSSFLCHQIDTDKKPSASLYAQLGIQNRGAAIPTFYSAAQVPARMGYQVWVDGTRVLAQPLAASDFAIASGAFKIFSLKIEDSWLSASRIEVRFDQSETDANSTTNACYESTPYPSVVLKDNGFKLTPTPFSCDEDRVL